MIALVIEHFFIVDLRLKKKTKKKQNKKKPNQNQKTPQTTCEMTALNT